MEDSQQQGKENKQYHLTRNVLEQNKFLGFNKRNIAEAIIFTGLVVLIVMAIPFTDLVTGMTLLVLCPVTFLFNLLGIKHRSFTQILIAELRFRKNRRRLHLRGPQYVRKKIKTTYVESEDESIAEHYYRIFKQHFDEFVDKYSEEENS